MVTPQLMVDIVVVVVVVKHIIVRVFFLIRYLKWKKRNTVIKGGDNWSLNLA